MQRALRQIRTGSDDEARHIDLNRCYARRSLGRLDARLSSVDFDGAAQAGVLGVVASALVDLGGELTGGCQHQGAVQLRRSHAPPPMNKRTVRYRSISALTP